MTNRLMDKTNLSGIFCPVLATHPDTQAIYLYGTWGTEYQRPDSDVDILGNDTMKIVEVTV